MFNNYDKLQHRIVEIIKDIDSGEFFDDMLAGSGYDKLVDIVRENPEFADEVFDIIKKTLKSDQHDDPGAYFALSIIAKIKPELSDEIFDMTKEAFKSGKDIGLALGHIAEINHEFADKVFDVIKEDLEQDKYYNVDTLSMIIEAKPELTDEIIGIITNNKIRSGRIDDKRFQLICNILSKNAENKSVFEVLDTVHATIKSDKNNGEILDFVYNNLLEVKVRTYKMLDKVSNIYRDALKSDKNNANSLKSAYRRLSLKVITIKNPELADKVLDMFSEALKSDKNNADSLSAAYYNLEEITIKNPELADKVLDMFSEALKSDKNNADSLKYAYYNLEEITRKRPELTDKVLDMSSKVLKSGKKFPLTAETGKKPGFTCYMIKRKGGNGV